MDCFYWFNKINKNIIFEELNYKDNEKSKLLDCFNDIIVKQKYDKQNYTQIKKIYTKNKQNLLSQNEIYIRNLAYQYLESIGLKQKKEHFMIEYWRHRSFGDKNKKHIFANHRDSYGAMLGPVNTCIFYLRKDKTFINSNLQIFGKYGRLVKNPIKTIETNNKIVVFDGDIFHKVLPYSGFGIRDCIVVQFIKVNS